MFTKFLERQGKCFIRINNCCKCFVIINRGETLKTKSLVFEKKGIRFLKEFNLR